MSCYSNLEICSFLQRKIIIHSILYYELDKNILSDKQFDEMSKHLVKLSKKTKNYYESDYFYCFYDFDGSSGFDLYGRLNKHDREYLTHLAKLVYCLQSSSFKET